jgi:hypothetical protein
MHSGIHALKYETKMGAWLQLLSYVRFEVFTVVTIKNAIFWEVTPCVRTDVSEKCIAFIIGMTKLCIIFLHSVLRLLVTANVVPSSLILLTLMMEAICSSKMSVLTRATQCNIQ